MSRTMQIKKIKSQDSSLKSSQFSTEVKGINKINK